jgi:beta-phosphoglucomutase
MLKAVIFDFDGVITDSEILHFRAFNEILAQFDVQITKPDYYKKYLGFSDKECYEKLIQEGRLPIQEQQIPDLVAQKKEIYLHLAQTEGHIMAGVRSFLELLHARHITLGICSGALLCEIEYILDQARIRSHFVAIVAADHVTRGKPDPEGFLLALQQLQQIDGSITAGDCVVIEDAHWGLNAARAAGMRTVAITNSYPADKLSMADRIVHQLDEITMDDLHGLCGQN